MIRLRHVLTQETNFPFDGLRKTAGPFTVNGPAPLRCIRAGLWVIGNTCKACVPPHTNEYCRRLTYCRRFHCCLLLLAMRMNATPALPEASTACSGRPARSPTCSQCRARRSIKTSTVTGLRLKKISSLFLYCQDISGSTFRSVPSIIEEKDSRGALSAKRDEAHVDER